MLRIKRNVDLKQLEGEDFSGWIEIDGFKYRDYTTISIDEDDLYDLIKANFIEKV